jgi:hypothetical protein
MPDVQAQYIHMLPQHGLLKPSLALELWLFKATPMMDLEAQRALMLSGQMYDDLTPELIEARARAVNLTDEYNRSFGQPAPRREAIL